MIKNKLLFCSAIALLCFKLTGVAQAQDKNEMKHYLSETGAFSVKIPANVETKIETLRISSDLVLESENSVSVIDQRPFKNSIKKYIIQLHQTLGPAIEDADAKDLVESSLDKYAKHYLERGAKIETKKTKLFKRLPAGELHMTYDDEEMGPQALRAQIVVTDRSKILQIVTSSDEAAFSTRSQDFFNSLQVKKGIQKSEGNIINDWDEYTSPMKIFSALFPPKAAPYITDELELVQNGNLETLSQVFYDPVRQDKIEYKIEGYKTGNIVTPKSAQRLLLERYIAKYLTTPKGLSFEMSRTPDNFPITSVIFGITDKKTKKKRIINLRATYAKDFIMVQEMTSSQPLIQSRFATNLLAHTLFHPKEAHKHALAKDKEEHAQEAANSANEDESPETEEAEEEPATVSE